MASHWFVILSRGQLAVRKAVSRSRELRQTRRRRKRERHLKMSLCVSANSFPLFKVVMPEKCALTILELNWNQPLGQDKIQHLSSYAHVVHTTAKKVISRHRKNENVFKMSKDERCTCKACKNTVFHCQICKFVGFLLPSSSWLLELPSLAPREELIVFAYQIWKPQLLSVVQFPFDNCHSPFSPTTFFEIGVYGQINENNLVS